MSDQELFDVFDITSLTHLNKLKRALKSPPPCAARYRADPHSPPSPVPPSSSSLGSASADSPLSPSHIRRPRPPSKPSNSSFSSVEGLCLAVSHTQSPAPSRIGRYVTPPSGNQGPSDPQNQISPAAVQKVMDLGSGTFTTAALAAWEGRPVVVKTLAQQLLPLEQRRRFWAAAARGAELPQHRNVVPTVGFIAKPLALVQCYADHGSLRPLLICNPGLPLDTLVGVAAGVAAGMAHLAAHGVVHRNLCARNVLLATDWVPQVSDYGIDREELGDASGGLRLKWMAPESLRHRQCSTKSDVWAFGVLLWEVAARGREPYEGQDPVEVAMAVASSGLQLLPPPTTPEPVVRLIATCLSVAPEDRPDFAELHRDLEVIAGSPLPTPVPRLGETSVEDV
eukprot:EG_transcript_5620